MLRLWRRKSKREPFLNEKPIQLSSSLLAGWVELEEEARASLWFWRARDIAECAPATRKRRAWSSVSSLLLGLFIHPLPDCLPAPRQTHVVLSALPCGVVVISIDGEGNPSRNGQTLKRETLSNGSRSLIRRGEKKEKLWLFSPLFSFGIFGIQLLWRRRLSWMCPLRKHFPASWDVGRRGHQAERIHQTRKRENEFTPEWLATRF